MDQAITATFAEWEDGFDLILAAATSQPLTSVWRHVTESANTAHWCAPWRYTDKPTGMIDLGFDDGTLAAQIVSCEEAHHVLLDIAGLGAIGISLRPLGEDAEYGDDPAQAGTEIAFTHTFESAAAARAAIPEVGPVWETHLRLLLDSLGEELTDAAESEINSRYEVLAEQVSLDA